MSWRIATARAGIFTPKNRYANNMKKIHIKQPKTIHNILPLSFEIPLVLNISLKNVS
jgi:hypothetical protein